MRKKRQFKAGRCYHLVSRIAHRAFFFDEEEKIRFVELLMRVEYFSGVRLIGWCVMSNHIHVYVFLEEGHEVGEGELLVREGLTPVNTDGAKVKSLGDGSLAFFRTDIDNFKEKECNGCGAKGGQKFPDSYMGLVDFTGCCNDHDICYGTCGRDKGVCDKNFGDCMRSKCEQALKYVYHEKVLCKIMADAYEKAVSVWGNSAFEAGQDSGCIWRPCCKKK